MSADWLAKTDAGLEVHQRLGAYIAPSALTEHMKASIRAVNMIYIIRDYSPITTVLAMALLPFVLIPTTDADDVFNSVAVKHEAYIIWAQRLFLAAHLARTFHGYFMYRHVGLSRVANIHSQEFWSAPCKSNLQTQYSLLGRNDIRPLVSHQRLFPYIEPCHFLYRDDMKMLLYYISNKHGFAHPDSAYRCLLFLFSLLPLPQKIKPPEFSVCGATASTTNERSKHNRAHIFSRLLRIDILLCSLFTMYALFPLLSRLFQSHSQMHQPFPFPSLLLKLLAFVFGVSKPVQYMIWPPTAPTWDELVVEDENGVKRPRGNMGSGMVETGIGASWMLAFTCELCVIWLCWLS